MSTYEAAAPHVFSGNGKDHHDRLYQGFMSADCTIWSPGKYRRTVRGTERKRTAYVSPSPNGHRQRIRHRAGRRDDPGLAGPTASSRSPPARTQQHRTEAAFEASRRFFRMPMASKARCISDLSYSGYIASGEEMTAGEADYSEIFTVCPDIAADDPRVRAQWPCHGPVPWPDEDYRDGMNAFTGMLGSHRREAAAADRAGPRLCRPEHLTD